MQQALHATLVTVVIVLISGAKMNKSYDSAKWYMNEVASQVVATTGIPSDRHHLGKILVNRLKDDPDLVIQIDGATDQSETNGSVLNRSIRCAIALSNLGLKKGDVMVLMAPNHIDLCIPHHAGLYLGIMVAAVDATLGVNELKDTFLNIKPKIIFCQSEKTADIAKAVELSSKEAIIVTFDEGSKYATFASLFEGIDDEAVKEFQPTNFDPESTVAYLTATSGTTGLPKTLMLTHKNLAVSIPNLWSNFSKFPTPTKMMMIMSPLQWLSAGLYFLFSPILKITRLLSSTPITPDLFAQLINKYKPSYTATSPTLMTTLMTIKDKCDFTCLKYILLGGSVVSQELIEELKKLIQSPGVHRGYGMSEVCGPAVHEIYPPPPGSVGRPLGCLEFRLVDTNTKQDVTEANVNGELWLRGPTVFIGYYNNPDATSERLTKDGWYKTGDILYRDQYWNMYFVERFKMLLKYRNHHVSPVEVEAVIMKHPGVLHVVVTGIPDKDCGDLVVACVIPKAGFNVSAQEIKDLVKDSLTDSKQLRGGVVFMKEIPTTSTTKADRRRIKKMVLTMPRE